MICFEEFVASGQDTLTSATWYHCVIFLRLKGVYSFMPKLGVLDRLSFGQFSQGFEDQFGKPMSPMTTPQGQSPMSQREREGERAMG